MKSVRGILFCEINNVTRKSTFWNKGCLPKIIKDSCLRDGLNTGIDSDFALYEVTVYCVLWTVYCVLRHLIGKNCYRGIGQLVGGVYDGVTERPPKRYGCKNENNLTKQLRQPDQTIKTTWPNNEDNLTKQWRQLDKNN